MKILGIIGKPVKHSLSPLMYRSAFEHLGMDALYLPFEVEDAEMAIRGAHALGFHGLNVTMPHKEIAGSISRKMDDVSRISGAVNTIRFSDEILGYNTDGDGALRAIESSGTEIKGSKILILGAGGSAKAIAVRLSFEDVELMIWNRSRNRANQLASLTGAKVVENLREAVRRADILINTTPVGMNSDESLLFAEDLHESLTVLDIVYSPPETRLLREAKKAGAKTVDGISVLLHQGALNFEIWFGRKAPFEIMEKAVREAVRR
ncbi:MAG: shikimate dehydrogenase [Archaeoglobi archaeon]|nr:shikimate dehydrogenase [Candidatus Mnemosynella bozhongmuii]MDI3502882.1 shikimate dehydrogenase [Archaeoglobi archaeon]MDK2781309.1 shikimate dehydrogenase [Archaeoglobi archaeon]